MSLQYCVLVACERVPHSQRAVVATGNYNFLIGMKLDPGNLAGMSPIFGHLLAAHNIPNSGAAVFAGGSEQSSIGAKRHAGDARSVAVQLPDFAPRGRVPDPNAALVVVGHGEHFAIGAQSGMFR